MVVTFKTIVILLLSLSIFLGLQGGMYFIHNRLQEIGLAIALGLYSLFVLRALFLHCEKYDYSSKALISIKPQKFIWWISPIAIAGYFATVPPYIYFTNTGSALIPSILASRHFGFITLIPILAQLWKLGFSKKLFSTIIDCVLFGLAINYVVSLNVLNLPDLYFSQDHYSKNLVVYDEWRGYRLKGPTYAIIILGLVSLHRCTCCFINFVKKTPNTKLEIFKGIIGFILAAYILNIIKTRFLMVTTFGSIILYIVFLSRRITTLLLSILLPFFITIGFLAIREYTKSMDKKMKNDPSYQIRKDSFEKAKKVFSDNYLFGFGQASYYSVPYTKYFGKYFAPSDLGLVGICFKYGAVGVGIYLSVVFFTIYYLVTSLWLSNETNARGDPILWAFTTFHIAVNLALLLQPAYVYAAGIGTLSLAIGYAYGTRDLSLNQKLDQTKDI